MAGFGGAVKLTGESEYRKALQQITRNLQEVTAEMKAVSSSYDKNDKSAKALTAQSDVLTKKLSEQTSKLTTLKAQYEAMSKQYSDNTKKHSDLVSTYEKEKAKLAELEKTVGTTSKEYQDQKQKVSDLAGEVRKSTQAQDANEKSMSKMRVEISNAQADCNKTAKELDHLGKEADEAGKDAKNAGDGFTVFKGILADLGSKAIQSAISGLKKLGGQLINVGKQAYSSYAEYEQLVGGVETLFGSSADKLKNYASVAYKTAGLSANQYMEQATSFSATLLQGLGGDTEKAVEYADMAIIDMADNANKMGTSIGMIQNAYQGFAKQNYTMLDNLKLGYGGTQEEMARLINDSGVLGDSVEVTAESVKKVPFDKIIEAIHKTQQEIGITGTTSKEAADTISGSGGSMKAAWDNLLVGIADDNQEIGPLLDALVESVITAGKNMVPRVKEIISGLGTAVKEIWNEVIPELAKQFPQIQPIVDALNWVKENAEYIISALAGIAAGFVAFKVAGIITTLVGAFQSFFAVVSAGQGVMAGLNAVMAANPVGLVVAGIAALVTAFITLWNTSEDFRQFWIDLWETIKNAAGVAWEAISGFFSDAWVFIKNTWSEVTQFFTDIWSSIVGFASDAWAGIVSIWETVSGWFNDNVIQPIMNFFAPLYEWFSQLFTSIWETIKSAFEVIAGLAEGCVNIIVRVWEVLSGWFNENVIQPISNFFSELWKKVSKAASDAWAAIKNVWKSVSGWFDKNIVQPVKNAFSNAWKSLKKGAADAWEGIKNVFKPIAEWFRNIFSKAWQKVKDVFSTGGKIFSGIKEGIVSAFKSVVNAIIGGINKVISLPFNAINKVLNKIRNISILGISPFSGLWGQDPLKVPQIPLLAKGGILRKGQIGLLEGSGTEAVVPLENNTKWIKRVAGELQDSMSQIGVAQPRTAEREYNSMVRAFKEALAQMKIELDDEVAGKFVERTVTRVIYS